MKVWKLSILTAACALLIVHFSDQAAKPIASELPSSSQSVRKPSAVKDSAQPTLKPGAGDPVSEVVARYKLDVKGNRSFTNPPNDPKFAYFENVRVKKSALDRLTEKVQKEKLESEKISEIGRSSLEDEDGFIQESALALLVTQPPSSENLEAILENIVKGIDPELIEKALIELQRYPNEQSRIEEAIKDSLLHGSPLVADEISKDLGRFLNSSNAARYRELAGELDENSALRAHLLAAFSTVD